MLLGHWKVLDRFVNRSDESSPFVTADALEFPDTLNFRASAADRSIAGTWTFALEQEVIYNPQLTFFEGTEEIGSAIITRYSTTEPDPDPVLNLTLYFTTGLEIVLEKSAG